MSTFIYIYINVYLQIKYFVYANNDLRLKKRILLSEKSMIHTT